MKNDLDEQRKTEYSHLSTKKNIWKTTDYSIIDIKQEDAVKKFLTSHVAFLQK